MIGVMRGDDFREWHAAHPLVVVFHNYALEGSSLENIHSGIDSKDGYVLTFGVKKSYDGGRTGNPRDDLYAWTSQFAEDKIAGTPKESYSRGNGWRMAVILNGTIISNPALRAALRDGGSISGRFSQREVNELVTDLNAGSLSFTPKILSEQNVSPELGIEERSNGIVASLISLALVVVAMVGYYKFAGLVASCAVLLNIFIMWGVLQNMDAALTLPGIAGIVLTIGMAVDANVLVFERIREEFKVSGRIASAIQTGYRKAFSAIIDSNITTIIAALILIQFDSGPIKGFAVTLIIGIASSMFTALFLTRYFFAGWVQNPKNKVLEMAQFFEQTNFNFLAQARKAILISLGVIVFGLGLFATEAKAMFGMDFTGGYSLIVNLQESADAAHKQNYRLEAGEALLAAGATVNDFQIRELSKPNQLRIQLSTGMEEKGHPFYGMADNSGDEKYLLSYQSNPKISWLVNALESKGLKIQEADLSTLDKNWTVISGQFSDTMRNNAALGLGLALLSILIYITFRFEFKYAIAAVIGLAHDVLITLGILAFLHWIGLSVQIDLQVVGALMTIIGYSLNDTIIIFDRVREDVRTLKKLSFSEVVNHSLNVTLSRTVMTSGTTLLVLLSLVILGGKSIFDFSLVMTLGVFVGTLSSLFIVAPVLIYFHNREVEQESSLKTQGT
jgi:SecD/SecF fusion protein